MLGLPILTGLAGFVPSFILFVIAWLFMVTTALLIVEGMGSFKKSTNMLSMVREILGPTWGPLCALLYLFLFYALLVAYMSISGNHTTLFFHNVFALALPNWVGTLFFVILFGWIVYLGTKAVDHVNRYLMVGKILFYILLIAFGIYYMTPKLLVHWQTKYALFTFPILIVSFGFHNMIPILMEYMGGDRRRVRTTIYAGSIFAFAIYLFWELIALGILPINSIIESYGKGIDAAQSICLYVGSSWIGYLAQSFAFFAILTSFLAQTLSLSHFLHDGFKVSKNRKGNLWICIVALAPPLLFTIAFPEIFFQAINFAGGICAIVLFGIFPASMAWVGRYQKQILLPDRVPGGKLTLILIFLIALLIFFHQIVIMFHLPIFGITS